MLHISILFEIKWGITPHQLVSSSNPSPSHRSRVMVVCILSTPNIYEARLAQSKLESHGILCELRTNDAGGILPHLRNIQGIELYISEKDIEKARKILGVIFSD